MLITWKATDHYGKLFDLLVFSFTSMIWLRWSTVSKYELLSFKIFWKQKEVWDKWPLVDSMIFGKGNDPVCSPLAKSTSNDQVNNCFRNQWPLVKSTTPLLIFLAKSTTPSWGQWPLLRSMILGEVNDSFVYKSSQVNSLSWGQFPFCLPLAKTPNFQWSMTLGVVKYTFVYMSPNQQHLPRSMTPIYI